MISSVINLTRRYPISHPAWWRRRATYTVVGCLNPLPAIFRLIYFSRSFPCFLCFPLFRQQTNICVVVVCGWWSQSFSLSADGIIIVMFMSWSSFTHMSFISTLAQLLMAFVLLLLLVISTSSPCPHISGEGPMMCEWCCCYHRYHLPHYLSSFIV